MTAAEELHAAAEKLRAAATLASDGPWLATPDVLIGGWAVAQSPMESDEGPYLADFVRDCDARYIAAMHPGVGTALADWLDAEAATWAGDEVHNRCSPQLCTLEAAVAVARAILGSQL